MNAWSDVLADTVRLYIWADYIDEAILEAFTERTGHEVIQTYYDNESERDEVMVTSAGEAFDLVLYDSHSLNVFDNSSFFLDLSNENIAGAGNHNPKFVKACGKYGIPYGWGTTGIAYRESVFPAAPQHWMDLFTPTTDVERPVVMLLDQVDSTAVALLALGKSILTESDEDLRASQQLFEQQAPRILHYGYPLTYAELHGKKSKMAMALLYSSDVSSLEEFTGQNDWHYVVPAEGSLLWVDCFSAPAGDKLPEAARQLLAYLNEPEVAAQNAEEVWFSTTNDKALEFVSDEYREDPVVTPSAEIVARSLNTGPLSTAAVSKRNLLLFSVANGQYKP